MLSARSFRIAVHIGIAGAAAACGAGPTTEPTAPTAPTTPTAPSGPTADADPARDPVTGQAREAPPGSPGFAAARSEHLCKESEDVVFACTLEGPPPQVVTSLCMAKGSPRTSPIVRGRERVEGHVEEPFAKDPGLMMITVLETGDVPFSIDVEQVTGGGVFGFEKVTDPRAPNAPPKYQRTVRIGRAAEAKPTRVPCDASKPLTDNLEAMRAYKL